MTVSAKTTPRKFASFSILTPNMSLRGTSRLYSERHILGIDLVILSWGRTLGHTGPLYRRVATDRALKCSPVVARIFLTTMLQSHPCTTLQANEIVEKIGLWFL